MTGTPSDQKVEEIAVKTALGDFSAKGIRLSDILGLVLAAVLAVQLYILYTHKQDAKEAGEMVAKAILVQAEATVAATKAQNFQTCIMSLSQDVREKQYDDKSSWCNRTFGAK